MMSAVSFNGMSSWCGPWKLPQQTCSLICSLGMSRSAWFSASTRMVAYLRYSGTLICGRQFQPSGQVRIVDLEQEAGIGDRLVLFVHRISDGVDEFLVALVVLVRHPMLDRAGRVGRQERLFHGAAGERRLESGEILLQIGLSDIAQLLDADRNGRRRREAGARIGLEIGGEFGRVARGDLEPARGRGGTGLVAGDPRPYIIGEIRFRQLAVIDAVE